MSQTPSPQDEGEHCPTCGTHLSADLMDELNRSRDSEASVQCPTTGCPRVLYKFRESGSTYHLEWQ